jgi:hypothetical protein
MGPRHAKPFAVAALLVLLGLCTGCALMMQRSADELRRQQSGSEPDATGTDSRRRKGKSPWRAVVHTAAYDAADGLVDGAVDATKDPKRREQLRTLGDDLQSRVESVAETAGAGIIDGVNARLPATQPVLVELVEQLRKELGIDPEQTGRKLMRGAMAEARTGVRDLRPEIHRLLEHDVLGVFQQAFGPGLKDRVRDDIKPAIDELGVPQLAEDVGKRAALGFSAGMAEALAADGSLGHVIDDRVDRAKQTAGQAKEAVDAWLARGLLLALIVAVVVIVVVVFWWLKERGERVEAQRAREAAAAEGERRERMLRLVTGAIKKAGARDTLAAFREEMRRRSAQDDERETAAALSYFLTREGLKLEHPPA